MHLLRQPINLPPRVAEDDGLGDGNGLIQIAQRVELPFLLLNGDVELLDTFKRQLIALDEDTDRFPHELLRHLEDIGRHRSREENNLRVLRQKLEDLVDLVLETTGQHLICLIETENLDVVSPESPPVDHIEHTSGSADNDLYSLLELGHILTNVGPANAGMTFNVHVVAKGNHDLLNLLGEFTSGSKDKGLSALDCRVNFLENGDGESRCLSSTGLGLSDDIVALDNRDDGTLLNGRRALETNSILRQRN